MSAKEDETQSPGRRRIRLAYLVSHPIQYQAPLLRRIAREPDIDLMVFFGSDFSVKGYLDQEFGVDVAWDTPLLEGYQYEFLPRLRDTGQHTIFSPVSWGLTSRLAGFDVVWVHGYATLNALHGILAANLLGIPVLLRSDSSLIDRPRSLVKLAAKRAFFAVLRHLVDGVLSSGTRNQQYWRHYMGLDFALFWTPYAVDNDYFQQQAALAASHREQLRAEFRLESGHRVLLFASKLQTRKHCGDLLEAYARLVAGGSTAYLLIVGDGEERAALEQQVADLGLQGVRFCGFRNQSELPRFFDLATVFVLPARHEPWGLVVNEVMNAGRPVIISDDVGCMPDLITHGVEGFVYPVRDIEALTHVLTQMLEPGVARAMGQHALAKINGWSFEQDVQGLKTAIAAVTSGVAR